MKIKVTLTEGMLGTASANPEVHAEFIASKSADKKKKKEELESLPADDLLEKSVTVFPRMDDGTPMLYDYQMKGFLKETLGILLSFVEKDCTIGKAKLSRWTYKKIVDNAVMVFPRKIALEMPKGAVVTHCVRPLRGDTQKGERVALATSEEVPAGTTFICEITTLDKKLDGLMVKCLDNGANKGIGQWRNSGKGRFSWEVAK